MIATQSLPLKSLQSTAMTDFVFQQRSGYLSLFALDEPTLNARTIVVSGADEIGYALTNAFVNLLFVAAFTSDLLLLRRFFENESSPTRTFTVRTLVIQTLTGEALSMRKASVVLGSRWLTERWFDAANSPVSLLASKYYRLDPEGGTTASSELPLLFECQLLRRTGFRLQLVRCRVLA